MVELGMLESASITRLCGSTRSYLFFARKAPSTILVSDYALNNLDSIQTPFVVNSKALIGSSLSVDSPFISLYLNNFSSILTCKIGDTQALALRLAPPLFTRAIPISRQFAVLRAFDSSRTKQFIEKVSIQNGAIFNRAEYPEGAKDFGFSSDGMLTYDPSAAKIIYVQLYQNKFAVLDTNLALLYVSHTIDTTNTNPVTVRNFTYDATGSVLPSVPLNVIKRQAFAYNGWLFVISNLEADNENNDAFNKNSVVDIYNISNGMYLNSFYIPNLNHKKVSAFKIYNNVLVALYKTGLATYQLPNISPI